MNLTQRYIIRSGVAKDNKGVGKVGVNAIKPEKIRSSQIKNENFPNRPLMPAINTMNISKFLKKTGRAVS